MPPPPYLLLPLLFKLPPPVADIYCINGEFKNPSAISLILELFPKGFYYGY